MRERVVKYLSYYVAMVALLLVVRFVTRGSETELKDLRTAADSLVTEQSSLRRQIDSLESPARVREWAVGNKMIPFSAATAQTQALPSLKAKPPLAPVPQKLQVRTDWGKLWP